MTTTKAIATPSAVGATLQNEEVDADQVAKIDTLLDCGVPFDALAFYGRWWQLERWLREMVYLELRAKRGRAWTERLEDRARQRAKKDQTNEYMASADADDLLAYSDVSVLFAVIDANWELFDRFLLPKTRWHGLADLLSDLRNRNAHCRRPHADDLAKLEQALRDLEPGAWKFYASFADESWIDPATRDHMVKAWIKGKHPTARRLLDHAEAQYDTRFQLGYALRPWATQSQGSLSDVPGGVWKANWFVGGPEIRPRKLVRRIAELTAVRDLLIYLELSTGQVTASFAAVDSTTAIADAVGHVFDAILETSDRYHSETDLDSELRRWKAETKHLPTWVQVDSAFTLADPHHPAAFKIFAAG